MPTPWEEERAPVWFNSVALLISVTAARLSEDLALQRVPLRGFFFTCVELFRYTSDQLVQSREE